MPIQIIESQRLYQRIAGQIAGLIRKGEWQPGERLPPERDLAAKLGVSRPTVREAMIALEISNLVEIRPGAGTYVRGVATNGPKVVSVAGDAGPSPFDLITARRLIEGEIAAVVAGQVTPEELDGLSAAIEKMESDIKEGAQLVSSQEDGDFLFHVRLAAASHNASLESIVGQLWEDMRHPIFAALSRRFHLPENATRAVREHRAVFYRLVAGDAAGARTAMHQHLDQVVHILMTD
jgi:DNA-binding FadR family transcriptional regulator